MNVRFSSGTSERTDNSSRQRTTMHRVRLKKKKKIKLFAQSDIDGFIVNKNFWDTLKFPPQESSQICRENVQRTGSLRNKNVP